MSLCCLLTLRNTFYLLDNLKLYCSLVDAKVDLKDDKTPGITTSLEKKILCDVM